MAHNEQSAGSGCALGLDWNATNTDGGTYKIAPTLWRYDSYSTDNYGSSWSEYLYYEPSGSTGHWTGGWGSGSGWRKYDSFSTRTYTKNHSSYTVKITINTDSEFGTWNGGWVTLGSKYYAWTITIPARTSYTVSFNANGGSGAPSNQTKWYGESLTLSSTTPTRTGYTFNGWNTKSDGTGTNYAKGASYTGNAALTLYAKWAINTWPVSYNGNGSTGGSTASQTKTYNTALTLQNNGFTKTNHVFKNWNTAANGSGTSYAAGASYTGNATLTLYAQWYAPYTVSYDANGGSGAPASQTKIYNSTLTLSSSTPTRANYNFIGWNTNEAGTGTSYSPGGSYTANAAATLYAVWEIAHANPTITNLLVRRCLSDGTPDNQGTNVLVEADWSVDTSTEGFEDTVGYQCRITLDNKVDTISLSGTSGHISRVHQSNGANTDILLTNKYPVTLAVEDSHNFVASKSSTISISFFTVHYKAGGTGIGVGKATNRDALDVGMEAYFDQDVHIAGDVDVAGDISVVGEATAGGLTVPHIYMPSPDWVNAVDIESDVANRDVMVKTARTDTDVSVRFGVGSGGVNHGIWSDKLNKWIIYGDATKVWVSDTINRNISSGVSYIAGGQGNAALYLKKATGSVWYPAVTLDTTSGGSWQMGNYNNEYLEFVYATKANRDSSTNTTTKVSLRNVAGTVQLIPAVLYNNTTGSAGSITLSASAANYNHMRVYYRASDNSGNPVNSVDIYSPNGKYFGLWTVHTKDGNGFTVRGSMRYISTTTMSVSGQGGVGWFSINDSDRWWGTSTATTNNIYVVRVEAWNE